MKKKKFIIIDGNSLIYRAFYGVRPMSTAKGIPTNAIFGFANILIKVLESHKPDYIGVAFDVKKPTFRHNDFEQYKAGRLKMPEELQTQIPLIYEMLDKMDIARISLEGYEADDLIGTIAKYYSKKDIEVDILTGDRDSFQLVDNNIKVLYTKKGISELEIYDEPKILDKYGLNNPLDLIEVKALMGDKSDNIPGVEGVGEKTALKLIKEYGSIENVYENIENLKGKLKERLIKDQENAFLSRHLAKIVTEVPVEFELDEFITEDYQNTEAINYFNNMECYSIVKKLGVQTTEIANETFLQRTKKNTILNEIDEVREVVDSIINQKQVYFTWHMDKLNDNLIALVFGVGDTISIVRENLLNNFEFIKIIKPMIEDENIKKSGHKLKDICRYFFKNGINFKGIEFDTYIASYLLDPADTRYDLDNLALKYLNIRILSKTEIIGEGRNQISFLQVEEDKTNDYLIENCEALMKLDMELKKQILEANMISLLSDIEMPLIEVLAFFESIGFKLDIEELNKLSKEFNLKLDNLTADIHSLSGRKFNINSPKQLGQILFDELKLPVIKKTKTGYSTNAEVLEKLKDKHPIIENIIQYRTLSKLNSTYIKGFKDIVDPKTERIYSTFNQTVTTTGRISSSEPNLQNIPVKMEMGRKIRRVFIPSSEDYLLVDADYSQIELRILAHISGDETLINSFITGEDIHTRTASEIFNVSLDEVTRIQRIYAKTINFGLIYGKQAYGLSQDLNISRKEAQEYIDKYFGRYPKVEEYMNNIKKKAKEKGYVSTLYGRRRYIPEINSRNQMIVRAGERIALNTPIQGSAADIIKIAMIRVYKELIKRNMKSKLILQVHDELLVDAHKDEVEKVCEIVKDEMENSAILSVPLTVELNSGKSWYDTK